MKVSIQVLGSLGDVMPYISVAHILLEKGVDVSILAPRDFTQLIANHGIEVAQPAEFSLDVWMKEAATRGTLKGPISFFRDWSDMIRPHIDDVMEKSLEASRGADIIVANLICAPARVAAEAREIPLILSCQQPVLSPTKEQPCAMMWRPWHSHHLNRPSYAMINLAHRVIGRTLKRHRRALGLSGHPRFSDLRTHLGMPLPKVTTVPWPIMTKRPGDWAAQDHLTAYPSLCNSVADKLDDGLRAFLDDGPAPVYVGLGSLGAAHGEQLVKAAIDGLEQCGQRGVIAKSMAVHTTSLPNQFHIVDHAPHNLLFPQCAAVMHHGGAGTTDTAIRAGVPQILQPHFLDQFWFSDQLNRLGVAPKALPARNIESNHVAAALTFALNSSCAAKAKAMQVQARLQTGSKDFATLILSQIAAFD